MKSTECAIIIPLYKDYLYDYEEISLKQCINVLNENYKIYFIMPNNLDIFQILDKYDINIKYDVDYWYILYDPDYFTSIYQFNLLLKASDIYKILKSDNYSYALLYELDGFVFYDNLKYWIDKGYDFIGSFLYYPNILEYKEKNIPYRMNGGVSLRNIDYSIRKLDKYSEKIYWEDTLLSFKCKNIPLIYDTLNFAWSFNYSYSYLLNDYKLPMFLHYYQNYKEMYDICKYKYENKIITNKL